MKTLEEKIIKIFLFSSIFFFVFFVFYNLNWGAPFYFHPDERNIASSIVQLKFPDNLNPNFFAYGAFPIYLIFILGQAFNFLADPSNLVIRFEQAIIFGRLLSGVLAVLSIFLIYKTANILGGRGVAILSSLLAATSTAYLQYSHFGTYEIWVSFFSLLIAFLFIKFLKSGKNIYFIFGSAVLGIITALKLSSMVLILIPIYVLLFKSVKKPHFMFRKFFGLLLSTLYIALVFYIISSTFNFLDFKSFLSSMQYEGRVAAGTLNVFYTGSFYNTFPILFQYQKVLPFLINPVLTLISLPALLYVLAVSIKKRDIYIGLVILSFALLFISGSLLFAKWTRYLIPSLSFLYVIISIFLFEIGKKIPKKLFKFILVIVIASCFVHSFSFIKTSLLSMDTRLEAFDFAKKNISPDSNILSEVYDLGITPFNDRFKKISLFNFYNLDGGDHETELRDAIKNADFIILPSQRILKSRMENKNHFPNGHKFYLRLFSGELGFSKIYETSCDIFCNITYLGNPVFNVEETANVFDRPTVFIFKNMNR